MILRHPLQDHLRNNVLRQDRRRLDDLTFPLPLLPQTRQSKRLTIRHCDVVRLLPGALLLPFIKAISYHEAAAMAEWASESRLRGSGLGPCVYQPVADGRIVRPSRDQAPAKEGKLPVSSLRVDAN